VGTSSVFVDDVWYTSTCLPGSRLAFRISGRKMGDTRVVRGFLTGGKKHYLGPWLTPTVKDHDEKFDQLCPQK